MRLLIGYVIVLAIYFGVKAILFLPLTVAEGEVTRIMWVKYRVEGKHGGSTLSYSYPEIQFTVSAKGNDTARTYLTTDDQSMSYEDNSYKPGEKARVSYPSGHPEKARVYSFTEYWLPAPNMVMLIMGLVFGTIAYVMIVYKPFKYMGEVS
ncbi:hypothetical protein CJD36_014385 [Flavipsychrobacter stenotrophus]|uniref:DUF3592 domain-containing protein n=1 Tax=Flavipsychrobacter stenotrophus TaxID=2077091 RepID=A0A2S7SX06_9BACT|nr:DUF3592 domain-containing protein [Flavipsychrobacter stenotrophus]PQJ11151.1 hypothetical protein CJD36_014385 [Flavipsychrobacter stenotrophus]